ncbi:hypothetical protein [Saccharopolyspora phatthalungensis]|uniref:Uncharacterized protein n=1 Tax=Saccharopolyspora phatthalungensis TaxID=664693 RepID=A0A840Q0P7_9PSEU|nr:hypothetical protein [Saccharopolyspora phatthalungensis]MBB5156102.1 hypothetical protein [Saccharopolyspora phatthalungensis]
MLIDVMCASLIKRKIPVTSEERDMLANLLAMYESPVEFYDYITNRDETLAALTVTNRN